VDLHCEDSFEAPTSRTSVNLPFHTPFKCQKTSSESLSRINRPPRRGVDKTSPWSHTHTFRSTNTIPTFNNRNSGRRVDVLIRPWFLCRELVSIPNHARYVSETHASERRPTPSMHRRTADARTASTSRRRCGIPHRSTPSRSTSRHWSTGARTSRSASPRPRRGSRSGHAGRRAGDHGRPPASRTDTTPPGVTGSPRRGNSRDPTASAGA
jgi:hypothetical protein